MSAEQKYKEASDKALSDFQSGEITFQQWNRIQSEAVKEFFNK